MAKVDTTRFYAKVRALESAGRSADLAAAETLLGYFAETVIERTPRDTNRAVNGWIQAGRAAGVVHTAMLPYNQSSRRGQYLEQLETEIEQGESFVGYLNSLIDRADRADRAKAGLRRRDGKPYAKRSRTASYKETKRRLRRAERRLARSREEYAKAVGSEGILFFDAGRSRRAYSTVRTAFYGGTGRVEADANGARGELVNREPHVRLIERNANLGHPYATALAMTRSVGFELAGTRYLEVSRRRLRVAG